MKQSQKQIMIFMNVKKIGIKHFLKLEMFCMRPVLSVMMRYIINLHFCYFGMTVKYQTHFKSSALVEMNYRVTNLQIPRLNMPYAQYFLFILS